MAAVPLSSKCWGSPSISPPALGCQCCCLSCFSCTFWQGWEQPEQLGGLQSRPPAPQIQHVITKLHLHTFSQRQDLGLVAGREEREGNAVGSGLRGNSYGWVSPEAERLLGRDRQRWAGEGRMERLQRDRQADAEPVGHCTGGRIWVIEPGSSIETGQKKKVGETFPCFIVLTVFNPRYFFPSEREEGGREGSCSHPGSGLLCSSNPPGASTQPGAAGRGPAGIG